MTHRIAETEGVRLESQEFAAARFLIEHGFYPGETVGIVRHIRTGHKLGRTLGSVWRAMHLLLDRVDLDGADTSALYRDLPRLPDRFYDTKYCAHSSRALDNGD